MELSRWRVSELLARLGWRGRWIGKRLPAGRIAPALGADRRMWSVGADDVDQHITAVCEAGVNFGVERRPSAVKYDESSRNARLLPKEESRGFSRPQRQDGTPPPELVATTTAPNWRIQ